MGKVQQGLIVELCSGASSKADPDHLILVVPNFKVTPLSEAGTHSVFVRYKLTSRVISGNYKTFPSQKCEFKLVISNKEM